VPLRVEIPGRQPFELDFLLLDGNGTLSDRGALIEGVDVLMIREAALGIAVIGPEGASGATVAAADLVCRSILEAFDLLAEPRALAATLRV
jgi:hypothetical protein